MVHQAENLTGITKEQVSKWRKRLADQGIAETSGFPVEYVFYPERLLQEAA
jgi:hypothetical protein